VRRGATEDLVAQLADYETSDLPERTKMALRFADRMSAPAPAIDREFHAALRQHFSDDQILDLGMTITFASGWQRLIEAFGIVPDHWIDGSPAPFRALDDD
jgi:alkylhydroperoxidase family enzyme